jgi:hypothetical protein
VVNGGAGRAFIGRNKSSKPVSVYVVPKREAPANMRTTSLDARLPGVGMRKVEVPGNDFAIVFVTTRTPIEWDSHARPDALAVYPSLSGLVMAVDGDAARMFEEVGLSQFPTRNFEAELTNTNPSQAASVYIVPTGEASPTSPR